MTDPMRPVLPQPVASRMPGTVSAAAITTIVGAAITGVVILIAAVGYALVGRAILDDFDGTGSIIAWFFGMVGTLLALCTAAVVASLGLLRRCCWAWWTLLALSPIAAVLGVVAAYYVLPLGVTAAAVAVFVLLLRPSTRAWITSATP